MFSLKVITSEKYYPDESVWINRLFEVGLDSLHIRKPLLQKNEVEELVMNIKEENYSKLVVHGHPDIVVRYGLKGLHLKASKIGSGSRLNKKTLSCSVHSWAEFEKLEHLIDYAFVSPFFDSISKEGYKGNNKLQSVPASIDRTKVVALGGIDRSNLRLVSNLGFKGAAVLGAVWSSGNPLKSFEELNI